MPNNDQSPSLASKLKSRREAGRIRGNRCAGPSNGRSWAGSVHADPACAQRASRNRDQPLSVEKIADAAATSHRTLYY